MVIIDSLKMPENNSNQKIFFFIVNEILCTHISSILFEIQTMITLFSFNLSCKSTTSTI